MSKNTDFDRHAAAWLADGPTELSDRVLDTALAEVHLTRQRRRWTLWRTQTMSLRLGTASLVAVVAIVGLVGFNMIGSSHLAASPSRSPIGSADPATSADASVAPRHEARGQILFVSDRENVGGNPDIFVMEADGAGAVNLTRDPDDDAVPAWSPDGSTIAYARGNGPQAEIWLMAADGSNQRKLTTTGGYAYRPTWAPDGARIAFEERSTGAILVISIDGSRLETIYRGNPADHVSDSDTDPAWSPDGSAIAYFDGQGISTMRPDGTNNAPYLGSLDPNIIRSEPAWNPDGTGMAVRGTLGCCVNHGIYVAASAATGWTASLVTDASSVTSGSSPCWSPDGSFIAFDSSGPRGGRDIYIVRPDGTGFMNLTNALSDDSAPAWRQ